MVPDAKIPTGGNASDTYYASAWVGIDGYACDTAILQTGVDFEVIGETVNHYGALQLTCLACAHLAQCGTSGGPISRQVRSSDCAGHCWT